MSALTRRQFLRVAAVAGAGVTLPAGVRPATGADRPGGAGRRAYVLVVDGLRPDEVTPTLMPNLCGLRAAGTWFPRARSLPVMETIPNHVMMMTGMRPDRTGVPANSFYDRAQGAIRDMDRPSDIRVPTLIERLEARGTPTGTVLSKQYLYGVFGARASHRWEPTPTLPVTGHAPDQATMDALLAMIEGADPSLVFANLGDVDRVGHSDLTGTSLAAARSAALAGTDAQLGRFGQALVASGRWSRSLVVVLADHSMDWSVPDRLVSLTPVLRADPALSGNVVVAQNGGADLLYWTGPAADREAGVARMRRAVSDVRGVLSVHSPADLRLGPEAGDLVAYCRQGWRFSDPAPYSNPIPGNHGHPASEPIPFLVTGGHPAVRRNATSVASALTVDVAPTVGSFLGLDPPRGGYDGSARTEALA